MGKQSRSAGSYSWPLSPQYIVLFVVKVLTGQMQEVNDMREYDVDDGRKALAPRKKEGNFQLPSALKEG